MLRLYLSVCLYEWKHLLNKLGGHETQNNLVQSNWQVVNGIEDLKSELSEGNSNVGILNLFPYEGYFNIDAKCLWI